MKASCRPLVKVCGITNMEDAMLSVELGASLIGVILDGKVNRHGTSGLIRETESVGIRTCAVYTSMEQVEQSPLNESIAQLHFKYTEANREYLRDQGIPVIGVSATSFTDEPGQRADYLLHTDIVFVLLDYRDGAVAHLDEIERFAGNPYVGIAGRIRTEDLEMILKLEPGLVDVSSSLEKSPGKKDPKKLESFFARMEELGNVTA